MALYVHRFSQFSFDDTLGFTLRCISLNRVAFFSSPDMYIYSGLLPTLTPCKHGAECHLSLMRIANVQNVCDETPAGLNYLSVPCQRDKFRLDETQFSAHLSRKLISRKAQDLCLWVFPF